jgi:hypothetical protein
MNNPWLDLPKQAPFTLPCDDEVLNSPKYKLDGLRFDAFPEPYSGNINTAKVVCLLLNPGFEEADVTTNFNNPYWVNEIRANLEHKTESPFLYLSPKVQETGGYRWWTARLKPLENAGVTRDELAQGLMMVEFFPYHSVSYKHNKQYIPSQQYQFHLVREAIRLGKTIIIMRAKEKWFTAVPELTDYSYLELSSPQNVSISKVNLDNKNGAGTFDKIVATLKERKLNAMPRSFMVGTLDDKPLLIVVVDDVTYFVDLDTKEVLLDVPKLPRVTDEALIRRVLKAAGL